MGAFSFATGFFDKLNTDRDRNEENDLKMQSNLMNIWASTTLPRIQKNREEDNAAVARMNDYMGMEPFQKTPELAFVAAKAVGRGEYKDANDFLEAYQKDSTIVPPEVRQKQLDVLAKSFSYDTGADGKVSNFRLKSAPDNSAPLEGSSQNSGWAALFGKRKPMDNAQEARDKFKGMTGEDPTSSEAVGGRFGNSPTSGTLNIKPVDRKAERQQEIAQQFALQQADRIRSLPDAFAALQKGPGEFLKYAGSKGAFYSKEELRSQQFQDGLKLTFVKGIMDGDFKDAGGNIDRIIQGKFDPKSIMADKKTPEEQAKEQGKAAALKSMMSPNGDMDWVALMSQPELFKEVVPNEKDRDRIENNFKAFMSNKLMTEQVRTLQAMGNGAAAALVKPPKSNFDFGEQPAPGGKTDPNEPADPGAARRATEEAAKEVPGAFWQLPENETPAEDKKETGEERFKRQVADPLSNAAQGIEESVNKALGKEPLRLGEHPLYKDQYTLDNKLMKAIEDGDEDTISKANPFAVARSLPALKNKAQAEKVIQSMRFTPADQAKAMDSQFQKTINFDVYGKLTKKYNTYKEAVANAPAGSLVQINGQLTFITQAAKDAQKGK